MSNYTITNPALNPNRVFILQKSELEKRWNPNTYHFERRSIIDALKKSSHTLEPLKFVSSFKKNIVKEIPENLPYLGLENIESNTGSYIATSDKESISSAIEFKKGQVLFPKLRPYLNKVYFAEFDGVCSTEFHVLNSNKVSNEYLANFLRTNLVVNQTKYLMSGNTLPRLQTDDIESLLIQILSKENEEKVNAFFFFQKQTNEAEADKLLSSIDDYLLVELGIILPTPPENTLKNRMFVANFKSIESRLDPQFYLTYFTELENAIKNSPNKTLRLDTIFEINRGGSPRPIHNFLTEDESGYNWVKIGDTKNNDKYIFQTADKIIPEGARYSRKVEVGDFILSNSMSFGRPYIMQIEGYIHDGWLLFKPKFNDFNADYFHSILSSKLIYQLFKKATIGGVVENLNIDLVKKVSIPVPPLAKQKEIAEHITNIRNQAQALKDQTKELLQKASAEIEEILLNQKS